MTGARSGLIPNGDFSSGLDGWVLSDPGAGRVEPSDRDAGEKLRVLADPSKARFINSPRFAVSPGAAYELKIGASLGPTADAGTFALVFLADREVGRSVGRFDPPVVVTPELTYVLTGAIPPRATQAFVQVSSGQGRRITDLALYDIRYSETGQIGLTGWALDRDSGGSTESGTSSGIANVSLFLDGPPGIGSAIGTATYGDLRDDVAQACGDARFKNSGWHISVDVGPMALGEHIVYAVAQSVRGTTAQAMAKITRAPSFANDPIGDIESPVDRAALPSVARITGWAIDRNSASGGGVEAVSIYLDEVGKGSLLGTAEYGDARPGLGLHFGDPRFGRSGWHFEWDTLDVPPGPHTLHVVIQSVATGSSTTLSRTVVVGTGRDVARSKPAQASGTLSGFSPANAVDGVATTTWNAGRFAPQWIEIDLQTVAPIERIRLVTAQAPLTGFTDHRVYGRGPNGDATLLHEFASVTVEGQVLDYSPPVPWTGIRFVRVETVQSPAWVAWREIEVDLAGATSTGSLRGTVRSPDGPVPGAQVELRDGSHVIQTAYSDSGGGYTFSGIPGGTYIVRGYGPSSQYGRSAETAPQALEAGAEFTVAPLVLTKR